MNRTRSIRDERHHQFVMSACRSWGKTGAVYDAVTRDWIAVVDGEIVSRAVSEVDAERWARAYRSEHAPLTESSADGRTSMAPAEAVTPAER